MAPVILCLSTGIAAGHVRIAEQSARRVAIEHQNYVAKVG
ncbi:hypothetical protein GGR20_000029 [Devosia subaequoris]|uniref:Uncharacterized protein n=1 Tax=Devosia subaequoris TaxID=395930 RepID=A0A7W6NA88_9HYPH|nr:hypothetical protein [Devosia subaequoris]